MIDECEVELGIVGRDLTMLEKSIAPFHDLTYDEAVEIITGKQKVNGVNTIDTLNGDLKSKEEEKAAILAEIEEREAKINQQGIKKGERNFNMNKVAQLKNSLKDVEEDLRNIPEWIASATNFTYGEDFGGSDETVLTRMFDTPIMVYDWPHEVKAFYLKRNPEDERLQEAWMYWLLKDMEKLSVEEKEKRMSRR